MSPKVQRLVKLLSRLPGVGEKTAQRYVLWLLTADEALARSLGAELTVLRDEVGPCERCGNVAEIREGRAVCEVCLDGKRDAKVLCVVARVHDLMAIERAGSMRGRYFVLGKLLSPLEGIGPEDLPLGRLMERRRGDGGDRGDAAQRGRRGNGAAAEARARAAGGGGDAHRQRGASRGRPRVRGSHHDGAGARGQAADLESPL